jgi:hypothetical protein
MLTRRSAGRRPQLTFTADFHELVQGDHRPGPCVLRYDPWRIVPPAEIDALPRSGRPVTAHINFHPGGGSWQGDLWLPPGLAVPHEADPAAQSAVMKGEFSLEERCEELEVWFSHTNAAGQQLWDSRMGQNYWLRFPTHDLKLRRAALAADPGGSVDRLHVEVESVPIVEAIELRWRLTHPSGSPRKSFVLSAAAEPHGGKLWTAAPDGVPIPVGATLVFDLVYTVGGRTFTDDNEGTWYLPDRA